jgi:hypothetical protein
MKVEEEAVSKEENRAKTFCKEILHSIEIKKAPPESGAFKNLGSLLQQIHSANLGFICATYPVEVNS